MMFTSAPRKAVAAESSPAFPEENVGRGAAAGAESCTGDVVADDDVAAGFAGSSGFFSGVAVFWLVVAADGDCGDRSGSTAGAEDDATETVEDALRGNDGADGTTASRFERTTAAKPTMRPKIIPR